MPDTQIDDIKDITRQLITDIKLLSVRLSSDNISRMGFVAALEMEEKQLNNTGIFFTSLKIEGDFPEMEDGRLVILYRIVQEVINNIVKHSLATEIDILLSCTQDTTLLRISDNGIGFDTNSPAGHGGAGLFNLQHRAKMLNANLDIKSEKGIGTIVTIKLTK